ncbi:MULTISPECIES: SDR family NAD(P)-dependent oxidoreductase [unclassified Flavobacterium]|uniref:SDR family NAD(P)-dependent oxidoreductase n=1 Tax=unclassified Flavobacterium TaxID=196869 RepID=UPI001F12F76B|nr:MULTISPECIES: SDR family NAD(P)-dependent oxidoreductase [unclassified Flavobacterium]UMY66504.1 SDR family NAD(P)-dependent oxidoreductase [Flavobacterium sp. HJ-32-4]HLN95221.1 SDR family NAD(P)-dependent oxidoreductase [Flavobacterium sp.]
MKTALITGATSGIGRATAQRFAEHGIRLIICGRREDRLSELQAELGVLTDVTTLSFDIRDKAAVFESVASLPETFSQIDILVNNAGNAHGLEPIQDGDTDDWDAMIDGNVKGLLYISRAVLPGMVARRSGHVINIGSISGKEVYANGTVYCATKFAVDALNRGMRLDLNAVGIRVGAIHPGMVETEFSEVRFKGDTTRAQSVYQGLQPLRPEDIADVIHFVVTRPYHVNIADLLILPTAQASTTMVNRQP